MQWLEDDKSETQAQQIKLLIIFLLFFTVLQYRMTESSVTQTKAKFSISGLYQPSVADTISRISQAVCIENMIKKNSMFAPPRLEPMYLEKPMKAIYNLKLTRHRKQIYPHQTRIAPHIGKSMSSLLTDTNPSLKEPRHKRNISAVWQNKKTAKERKIDSDQPPTTASFYLKKGDNPIFYELKMDIKKVDPHVKPIEHANSKAKYRSRNFPIHRHKLTSPNLDGQEISRSEPKQGQRLLQIPYQHEIMDECGSSTQTKVLNPKQRYIKSTLMSYSSKLKFNRNKQTAEIVSSLFHVKNILGSFPQVNEESIQFFEPHGLSFVNSQSGGFQPAQKTANCYCVSLFNDQSSILTPIFMKEPHKKVQIASITKIMTCLLVLNIAKKFRLNISSEKTLISQRASKMPGTSAQLCYSDILTIYQLLHALMLPSGNDAALSLAEWGGKTIRKYCSIAQKYSASNTIDIRSMNFLSDYATEKKSFQKLFIYHMNKAANILNLRGTKFANPHGLMNEKAYSTSHDISLLTCIAMSNSIFSEIVRKKQFICKVHNRTYSQSKTVSWRNTNRLLNTEGFVGVKTGVTPSAGPCLASMFRLSTYQYIVIIVLKTKSMELRFKESLELLKQSLSVLNVSDFKLLMRQINSDQTETTCWENDEYQEEANLVEDQKQINSDQDNDEDEEDGVQETQ